MSAASIHIRDSGKCWSPIEGPYWTFKTVLSINKRVHFFLSSLNISVTGWRIWINDIPFWSMGCFLYFFSQICRARQLLLPGKLHSFPPLFPETCIWKSMISAVDHLFFAMLIAIESQCCVLVNSVITFRVGLLILAIPGKLQISRDVPVSLYYICCFSTERYHTYVY